MITFSALGLIGNLGNQLFQIASTIGIAEKNKTEYSFPEWKYSKYFSIPLTQEGIPENKQRVAEKQFNYEEINLKDANLYGFYQSEKYWVDCKEKIFKQFEFELLFKDTLYDIYKEVLTTNHVAISIRRGDFVNNPHYAQIPISWYLSCYNENFKDYNIIIFTDDFNYCKEHFKAIPNVTYANLKDVEQLCLMSMCNNHIISNSTFSWWGAYLSQSKNVFRPEKNFAGELAKQNDEKDYWIKEWKVYKDERIDLTDVTFIIPVFFDHIDRRLNMMLTITFLQTYFDTNIIIGEQGGDSFKEYEDYADYIQFDMPVFHRTKMINEMAKAAKTPIVVNWDCDNICSPSQLMQAVDLIRKGAEIVYPFDGTVYRVPRHLFHKVSENVDVFYVDKKQCAEKHSSVGHAVVMNKEAFIRAGMENENFISWTPEDSERYNRFHILEMKVERVGGAVYHMDHFVGLNSSTRNPHYQAGANEFTKVATMKKPNLEAYIKTWEWVS